MALMSQKSDYVVARPLGLNPAACRATVSPHVTLEKAPVNAESVLQQTFGTRAENRKGHGYQALRAGYTLGWMGAQQCPHVPFQLLRPLLQRYWEQRKAQSQALAWSDVTQAVEDGWTLGSHYLRHPSRANGMPHDAQHRVLVQPLFDVCCSLTEDFDLLLQVPLQDFVQQVLQRHAAMLRGFADELAQFVPILEQRSPQRRWLHLGWLRFQRWAADWTQDDVLAIIEQREAVLLKAYHVRLAQVEPELLQQQLTSHAHTLQRNLEKLRWVQHHWRP